MTSTVLSALVLGLFAGMAPGPYTTMVVATGLEAGFRPAARLALAPLVTDVAPLVVTALLLDTLSQTALTIIGVVGGAVLVMVGLRFLANHRAPLLDEVERRLRPQSASFGHVVASALFSPAPWLFWLIVGSPLMLRSWNRSPQEGVIFVVLLFSTNIGTATTLAWVASHGGRIMSPRWRMSALLCTGVILSAAGGLLVWQALEGNFQALMDRNEELRLFVEDRIRQP